MKINSNDLVMGYLNKREYFIGFVMQGMLANYYLAKVDTEDPSAKDLAQRAIVIADALIEELEQEV